MFKPRAALMWLALLAAASFRVGLWYLDVSQPLPACAGQALQVTGRVEGYQLLADVARFVLVLERSEACPTLGHQRFRVTWRLPDAKRPETLSAAQSRRRTLTGQLSDGLIFEGTVRLRQARGSVNPGTFDYEHWLYAREFRGTGYVVSGVLMPSAQLSDGLPLVDRQGWGLVYPALLKAIALGQRTGVSAESWATLRDTGTIHLMVVSGLHVGILAGATFALLYGCLRCMPGVFSRLWRRHVALVLAACVVVTFVWQTGFQAPLVRAAAMLLVALWCLLSLRRVPWVNVLALVGLVTLICHPPVALQIGFWLSYLGVACLLVFFAPRTRLLGWVTGLLCCQMVMFLGLTPWLGWLAGQVPLVSPVANLLVTPLVSTLCVPFAMYGFFCQSLGFERLGLGLLIVADFAMYVALEVLQNLQQGFVVSGFWPAAGAVTGGLGFLLLQRRSSHAELTLAVLVLALPHQEKPVGLVPGQFRVQVLDVGQGNAAVVDTVHHRLVVDAGPSFAGGFDAGAAVVRPVLRLSGPNRLDRLLISHFDLDHAGGVAALQSWFPQTEIISPRHGCSPRRTWVWDQVRFTAISLGKQGSRNERSCTLLVQGGGVTAFFSGDIGKRTERLLMEQLPPRIDFLLAPHHGSGHSSHRGFVRYLRPVWVVFSAGYKNRYGHPKSEVIRLYQMFGAHALLTALDGGIVFSSARPDRVQVARPRGLISGGVTLQQVGPLHE